jgi:hypothetical protein
MPDREKRNARRWWWGGMAMFVTGATWMVATTYWRSVESIADRARLDRIVRANSEQIRVLSATTRQAIQGHAEIEAALHRVEAKLDARAP